MFVILYDEVDVWNIFFSYFLSIVFFNLWKYVYLFVKNICNWCIIRRELKKKFWSKKYMYLLFMINKILSKIYCENSYI